MTSHTESIPHRPEADTFDLKRTWISIRRSCLLHKWLIVATALVTVAIVSGYILIWPHTYVGKVTVIVDPETDAARDAFYQSWNVFRKDLSLDEAQQMRAAPVIEMVVDDLDLTFDDVYHPFLTHAAYLWRESRVGGAYRAVKERVFPRPVTEYDPTDEEIDRARTINCFQKGVAVVAAGESNAGTLIVRGPSARVAQVANTLIERYLDHRRRRHVIEAQTAYHSLYPEVEKAREKLYEIEANMEEYYDENGLQLLFERDKVELARLQELKASIVESASSIETMQKTLAVVDRQISLEDREIVSARVYQRNAQREALRESLSQLRMLLEQTLLDFQPDSPEVEYVRSQIESLRTMIEAESDFDEYQSTRALSETYEVLRRRREQLRADLEGLQAGLEVRVNELEIMEEDAARIPEKMRMAHRLGREHSLAEKRYMLLSESLTQAEVSIVTAVSAPPSMRVVEYAVPPEKAAWPNSKLLLAGALAAGLAAGVVLALLVELMYARVGERLRDARGEEFFAVVSLDRAFTQRLFSTTEHQV